MMALLERRAPSAAGWTHTDANQLLAESFRARVLCLTSKRFETGRCPAGPLAMRLRPYQIHGLGVGLTEKGARASFCRWRAEWRCLLAGTTSIGVVSRRRPLSDERLRAVTSVGDFGRLQILTDFISILGRSYVQLPKHFGNGVILDRGVMVKDDLEDLQEALAGSGVFTLSFRGRPRLDQVAHLVCEVRQALLRGRKQPARDAFFCEVDQLLCKHAPASAITYAGRRKVAYAAAEAIAAFATR